MRGASWRNSRWESKFSLSQRLDQATLWSANKPLARYEMTRSWRHYKYGRCDPCHDCEWAYAHAAQLSLSGQGPCRASDLAGRFHRQWPGARRAGVESLWPRFLLCCPAHDGIKNAFISRRWRRVKCRFCLKVEFIRKPKFLWHKTIQILLS